MHGSASRPEPVSISPPTQHPHLGERVPIGCAGFIGDTHTAFDTSALLPGAASLPTHDRPPSRPAWPAAAPIAAAAELGSSATTGPRAPQPARQQQRSSSGAAWPPPPPCGPSRASGPRVSRLLLIAPPCAAARRCQRQGRVPRRRRHCPLTHPALTPVTVACVQTACLCGRRRRTRRASGRRRSEQSPMLGAAGARGRADARKQRPSQSLRVAGWPQLWWETTSVPHLLVLRCPA